MSYQKVILVGTVVHTPQYRQKRENVEQATRLQLMTERPTANGGTEREITSCSSTDRWPM